MIGLFFGETIFPKLILKNLKKKIKIFNYRSIKEKIYLKKILIHTV